MHNLNPIKQSTYVLLQSATTYDKVTKSRGGGKYRFINALQLRFLPFDIDNKNPLNRVDPLPKHAGQKQSQTTICFWPITDERKMCLAQDKLRQQRQKVINLYILKFTFTFFWFILSLKFFFSVKLLFSYIHS